jgi:hypothetical protein
MKYGDSNSPEVLFNRFGKVSPAVTNQRVFVADDKEDSDFQGITEIEP